MLKLLLKIVLIGLTLYVFFCILLYFRQEKTIFDPIKISGEYEFKYQRSFIEVDLTTEDQHKINCLYFKANNPKGVIYYLHGKSGNLSGWGQISDTYLDLDYDVFIPDYRGFGKSEGKIESEKQFYQDAQLGYDYLKERFNEDKIVVVGFSMGTGAASFLASTNQPKLLILKAPYYNYKETLREKAPYFPSFLLKYEFDNALQISETKCPVYIFHGDNDVILTLENSSKLKNHLKPDDQFITLKGQKHWGINKNPEYLKKLKNILDPSQIQYK